jgi:hypothetical protein
VFRTENKFVLRDYPSFMKPRNTVAQTESCTHLTLDLIEHDGRFFLECEGRQVDGSNLGHAAREIVAMMSRPFRPAKQPRIIFLGLGFGHAVKMACEALPQEKASFVILPEATILPEWMSKHLAGDPLDDERVHLESDSPFAPLSSNYAGSQGIFADLDHLDALAPKRWSITSEAVLSGYANRLKKGGLLGLISTRPIPGLEKILRKAGFDVATDLAPLSEKSKKNRTLYLARKGHYQRTQ